MAFIKVYKSQEHAVSLQVYFSKASEEGSRKHIFLKYNLKLSQKHKYICDFNIKIKNSFYLKIITYISKSLSGQSTS